jgi:hypothetical protein
MSRPHTTATAAGVSPQSCHAVFLLCCIANQGPTHTPTALPRHQHKRQRMLGGSV